MGLTLTLESERLGRFSLGASLSSGPGNAESAKDNGRPMWPRWMRISTYTHSG